MRRSALIDTQVIYCGDNLDHLRNMPNDCVDLVYIDPPFNSNRNYEVFWGEAKEKRSFEDRHGSTQAYIEFMRPRCVEIARVLKETGSFYYHCDRHASHYVKVMLDMIFGEEHFQNEIVWKRSTAHTDAKQGSKHYGRIHDVLLFYAKGKNYTWNQQYTPLSDAYVKSHYTNMDPDGRRFRWDNLTGPGGASKGNAYFTVLGVTRYWRYSEEKMAELLKRGMVDIPPNGKVPALKRYLDQSKGTALQSVWDDLPPVNSQAKESIGYPTQKPLALMDRIIATSSKENDVVLDAFCGCGTALVSAQLMRRQWIGIDVSPTACRVMAKRLRDVVRFPESEDLWRIGRGFVVRDLPQTEQQLKRMPPFEFENWAVIAVGGLPNAIKVGDMGIDGRIFPVASLPKSHADKSSFAFMDDWFPVQVKQKDKAARPEIDQFEAVMMREDRTLGFFVAFGFTADAERETRRFAQSSGREIRLIRVAELIEVDHERVVTKKPPASVTLAEITIGAISLKKSR